MATLDHLNCGTLQRAGAPTVACHCLLVEDPSGLVLIDAGIGLCDVAEPARRIGAERVEQFGFQFDEALTAVRQLKARGHAPDAVRHIVLTHLDADHVGGLADFPTARVHVSERELAALRAGSARYAVAQFAHGPRWDPHGPGGVVPWFGLDSYPLPLGLAAEVRLVSLPGHTHGHCGVAVSRDGAWTLHVGDAYYLRVELERDDHPVSALSAAAAEDDARRRTTLRTLRRLQQEHGDRVEMFCYHDPTELPAPLGWPLG